MHEKYFTKIGYMSISPEQKSILLTIAFFVHLVVLPGGVGGEFVIHFSSRIGGYADSARNIISV